MSNQADAALPALNAQMRGFMEAIAQYYEHYGIPRIAGRMFGLFLLTTEPLSAEQIAQALDASLSSVSTNVRALIANGWVDKVTFPGERTTYYRFSPSAWEHVMERRKQSFQPLQTIAQTMLAELPADHPAREQLSSMSAWTVLLKDHYDRLIADWRLRTETQASHPGDESE